MPEDMLEVMAHAMYYSQMEIGSKLGYVMPAY
jgi:hypothetical protein